MCDSVLRAALIDPKRSLRGDRTVLRPLSAQDLRRCVKWFSDPNVLQFLARSSVLTLAEEERWFREYERKPDEQIFAIEVDGTHVGNVGLHRVDRTHRKAVLGIVIGEPTLWSKGYGTDAVRAALRYAFHDLGLHKISLEVLRENARAIRVYEKVGFAKEGVMRDEVHKDGRFLDVLRMSILDHEFMTRESGPVPGD